MVSATIAAAGIGATIVLLAVSAFFSSSEIALFSLTPEWLDAQTDSEDPRATTVAALRANPHRLLVTILVGNNVVNVAISSIVTALTVAVLPDGIAVVAATVVTSVVVLLFGEIVPKAFGLGNAQSWALRVAKPITGVETVLSPIVSVFEWVATRMNAWLSGDPEIERPYLE